jgi:Lon protease-like protein
MAEDLSSLSGFSGKVRLFPLPNLVLFPHVLQPLHIFEPRYRQLMEDALDDDRMMALALLRPGWEEDYHKQPPIHPVVCIGKILNEEKFGDGRYNLMLQGLCRARIDKELQTDRLYRVGHVHLMPDSPIKSPKRESEVRKQLGKQLGSWFANHPTALGQLNKLLQSALPSGALCDIFSFALPIDSELKQQLLEQTDVERRVHHLIEHLQTLPAPEADHNAARKFPPEFSHN